MAPPEPDDALDAGLDLIEQARSLPKGQTVTGDLGGGPDNLAKVTSNGDGTVTIGPA